MKDLVERKVNHVLEEDESNSLYAPLVNHIIEALGNDASWVELYGVTGELLIPEMPQDSDFGEKLKAAKEVSQFTLK